MTWIFDQPAWIIVMGVVVAAILGMLWANTGRNYWLILLGSVIALTVGLLVAERLVETDQEALRRTVHEIADDVEKNDRTLLNKYIHSQATALQQKANSELPNYNFSECTVTKIYVVKVEGDQPPRKSSVEFMVRAAGDFKLGADAFGGQNIYRFVTLFFEQEADGKWRVVDYAHSEPTSAFMQNE